MKILFDDLARNEYQDAIEFYELEVEGLGLRFKEEVKRALRNLKKFPNMGSIEKLIYEGIYSINSHIRFYIQMRKNIYMQLPLPICIENLVIG